MTDEADKRSPEEVMAKPKRQAKKGLLNRYRIGTLDEYQVGEKAVKFGFECTAEDLGGKHAVLVVECEDNIIQSLVDAERAIKL